jgi:hypothetical protein
LKAEKRQKLKGVSTATLCTARYKRGLRNQFFQDVGPPNADAGRWPGRRSRYATPCSRIATPQRKAIEDCPPGAAMVIDSRKRRPQCTPLFSAAR